MRALPLFHAIAGRPVIVLGEGESADAKRRLVERAGGLPTGDASAAARLAFVALEGPEEAAASLKARGVLVNVVDRPDLCDFTVPSLLDRDPVLVAIGTAGASAGLAKHVRLRLERIVPAGLGRLAMTLHDARDALRAKWSDAAGRRRALDAALAEGGPLDPFREGAADRVATWLAESNHVLAGEPIEIRLASGDPDDLTLRQARLLGAADAVVHDRGVSAAILDRARADAVRVPLPCEGPWPGGTVVILRRS